MFLQKLTLDVLMLRNFDVLADIKFDFSVMATISQITYIGIYINILNWVDNISDKPYDMQRTAFN